MFRTPTASFAPELLNKLLLIIFKMQGSGQRCVYILQPDNTVESSLVKLGRHIEGMYEILEGVSEGDVIAAKGSSSLKDGSKVEVSNK